MYTELFALENKGNKISVFSNVPLSELSGNKTIEQWNERVNIVVNEEDLSQLQKMLKTPVIEKRNYFYSTGKFIGLEDNNSIVVLERPLSDIVGVIDAAETYASTHDCYSKNLQNKYTPKDVMAVEYGVGTGRISKKEILGPVSSSMKLKAIKALPTI